MRSHSHESSVLMPYQPSSSATLTDVPIAASVRSVSSAADRAPSGISMSTSLASFSIDDFRSLLHEHFGFPDFREGQERVLRALAENDVLTVMPTGSGKSMCYILPALAAGRTLVVSPLIALMQDQVESLAAAGIPAGFINSGLDRREQNRNYVDFIEGRLKLLYVAPERFANDRFVAGLRQAGLTLLAIDEAHCMSEWGHDFRPDYLMLGSVRERLGSPRTLALTATAEPRVQQDIGLHLGISDNVRHVVTSVDRPNLRFVVVDIAGPARRRDWLLEYVEARKGQPGIVYVRTRQTVEDTVAALREAGIVAAGYHAGMPAEQRARTQRQFTLDEVSVVVATNAFGLGVDKADVRFVVHLNMPGRLESYYQEAGRAGRDGDGAECTLLYDPRDERAQRFFIDRAHPNDETVRNIWRQMVEESERSGGAPPRRNGAGVDEDGYGIAFAALRHSGLIDEVGRLTSRDPNAPIDTAPVGAHRRYAEDRLGQIVEFAESARCRHMLILTYFGEQPADRCEACDNCLGIGRNVTIEPVAELSDLLSTLRDGMAARYRREPYEILDPRTVRELATYRPSDDAELLETWGIGDVKLGWFGGEVLAVIREWEEAHPEAADRPDRPTRTVRRKPSFSDVDDALVDDAIYERLTKWRRERSLRDSVPAYVVFSNKTLREIASVCPEDLRTLAEVWGVGQSRVARYGAEVLAVVDGSE